MFQIINKNICVYAWACVCVCVFSDLHYAGITTWLCYEVLEITETNGQMWMAVIHQLNNREENFQFREKYA